MSNLVEWHPNLIQRADPGSLCFYGIADLEETLEMLPDGTQLFGTKSSLDWIRIRVPVQRGKRRGMLDLVPGSVWGDEITPEDALEAWENQFGYSRPTPGGAARKLVRDLSRSVGIPLWGANGYSSNLDLVERLSTTHLPGPIFRMLEPRINDAVVVDMRAAYLWALSTVALPYGRPYLWSVPSMPTRLDRQLEQIPEALAGIVSCDVYDPKLLHAREGQLDPLYTFRGTWLELRQALARGRIEQRGPLSGVVFNTHTDATLYQALKAWLPGPERILAKQAYTRGWVQHIWPGYRRGVVARDPGQVPNGYRTDPDHDWIHWIIAGVNPTENRAMARVMQRPDRSAHAIGAIRSKLLDFVQDVYDAGGQVGQVLVDAVVCSREQIPKWVEIGDQPGQWKLEHRGQYHGSAAGVYQIRTPRGEVIRDRHCGSETPFRWSEIEAIIEGEG